MGLALGWMAIALAGLAGAPKMERANGPIQYTVRFVETEGLGWREAVFTRLTPVSRQGAATIWTAPQNVIPRLMQSATKGSGPNGWTSPIMSARNGSPVHFAIRKNQQLVTQVAWNDDERPETGKPETVRTGPVGTMTGRQLDQGVLVQLVLEDTEVRAIHRVSLGGSMKTKCSPETKKAAYYIEDRAGSPDFRSMVDLSNALISMKGEVERSDEYLGLVLPTGRHMTDDVLYLSSGPEAPCVSNQAATCESAGKKDLGHASIPAPGGPVSPDTIAEIRIEGNVSIPAEKIKAKLLSRAGEPVNARKMSADFKTLTQTKWFSYVQMKFGGKKNILTFVLHEMPTTTHADRAGVTCQDASPIVKSTTSTDCACQKDDVIRAHLETTSPASPCCTSSLSEAPCAKADEAQAVAIEVPEIASQEIAGEWLIPKDGILLVSFGPHTVADQDGKAVIRERLAIVEAEGVTDGAVQRTSRVPSFLPSPHPATAAPRVIPAPVVVPNLPTAVPVPPSRSIPQGAHPDGTPAELPPLPADETETPHPSDSAEPTPSPQIKKSQQPARPAADAQMKKTGYLTTPRLSAAPALFLTTPNVGLQFLVPLKPFSFQLPFNRRLEIEIFGRVVPNPAPIRGSTSTD